MKAILVRDEMPTHCGDCEFAADDTMRLGLMCVAAGCEHIDEMTIDIDEAKPGWCPWRPAPDFKDVPFCRYDDYNDDAAAAYGEAVGWNQCLSELGL